MTKTSFVAGLTLGLAGMVLVILPATPSFAQVNGGNGVADPFSGGGGGGGGSFGGGTGGLGAVGAGNGGNGTGGNATGNGGGGAGVGGGGGGFFSANGPNDGAPGSGTIGGLTNTGIIQGGAGALDNLGDGGGGGGAGIGGGGGDATIGAGGAAGFTITNSTITNSGTISGGAGGNSANYGGAGGGAGIGNGGAGAGQFGGAGGAGLNGLIIINSGTIQGGNGGAGVNGFPAGAGGAGIAGSGMTVTNLGTIVGGLNGIGDGTRANAITFTGGSNTLTLQTGSVITGNIAIDAGTLTFNQSTAQTLSNIVTGAGGVINTGTGTLTFSGANTYAGGTTLQGGTLQLSGAGTLGAVTGLLAISNGTLDLGGTSQTTGALTLTGGAIQSGTLSSSSFGVQAGTISAMLAGGGALTKTGPGSVTLSGANTYAGGTTVQGGTLLLSGAGTLGATAGLLAISSATLDLGATSQTTGALTLTSGTIANGTLSSSSFGVQAGTISAMLAGGGALTKTGPGSVTLSGANTYAGGTTVQGGTLLLSGAGTLGAATGSLAISSATLDLGGTSQTTGALTLTSGTIQNGTLSSSSFGVQAGTISAILAGGGALTKTGPGTLTLSGANTYAGGTTLTDGVLQIQNGLALGAGTVTFNGGTLRAGGSVTVANAAFINAGTTAVVDSNGNQVSLIGGLSGQGGLTVADSTLTSGRLILSSLGNDYAGPTTITGGLLQVDGAITQSVVTVASGGTLGGKGTISQSVTVQNGGRLAPGDSPGTLTVGSLNLNAGSTSTFELGMAGVVGGVANDLVNVTNNLTLGGTLSVNAPSAGYYRLFNYGGSLSGTFDSVTGSTQGTPTVLTNVDHQVNLSVLNGGQQMQFWDGADMTGNGTVDGGAGTWNASNTNWTGAPGNANFNDQWRSSVGVFAGAAGGAVSVVGAQSFDTLQFSTTGYVLNAGAGGQLLLAGASTGTINTDSGITATINAPIGDGTVTRLTKVGGGTLILGGANTYTGGTTIASGTLQLNDGGSIGGNVANSGVFAINHSDAFTFAGLISGAGSLQQNGTGTTTLTATNTYTGGTTISGGTLQLGDGGTSGSITGNVANSGILSINHSDAFIFAGLISGAGSLQQNGSGTTTLSGAHTYTGATSVNAGILDIEGSIASSSMTTVNSGATLTGLGTVGNTTVAGGGTFAPGNGLPGSSMTVNGNLALQSGALYLVQINPATASFANVTGTATLGGASVQASFSSGSYVAKQYTILEAGVVSGQFNTLANTNLPSGFTSTLSYGVNNVYLNLALSFAPPPSGGLTINQQNVANAIVGFFNSNGGIPMVFGGLSAAGLTQASGELATGSQQTTFDAMNLFMGVLTDPFVAGRGDPVSAASHAPQFADGNEASAYAANGRSRSERDAYAAINDKSPFYKAPPRAADPFSERWSVWAAGYGGSQTTDGNASPGSNTATSRIFGMAVGADYRISPNTLAGFALAGGGTNFSMTNGLGSGRSDLFQVGAFVRHTVGAAYVSAALVYGWQDITTDRTVAISGVDLLRARFSANAFSGRIESGYRFVTPWMGLTPYAAGQFTTFDLPAYAEQVLAGTSNFALSYAGKDVTASRTELGLRTDKSYALQDAMLTLRGRAAWAHDFNTDRSIAATFQTLPGASFVVNGAAQARDAALVTASAEMKWLNGFSLAATFEGEFSNVTSSYAGKGVVRYGW